MRTTSLLSPVEEHEISDPARRLGDAFRRGDLEGARACRRRAIGFLDRSRIWAASRSAP
ncbi:MAG: hypothetical protein HY717_23155 [Planctomycetes bacterium]|nr:hypothetical protein [Planctomycetota bacterium]